MAWYQTCEEKFGESGRKGDLGEQFVIDTLTKWGWEVVHHQVPIDKQAAGVDIEFRSPNWEHFYSADVKANINDRGSFYVEIDSHGWLYNTKKTSHRIWHCNPRTGQMAWYDREDMKRFIASNKLWILTDNSGKRMVRIAPSMCRDFIKRVTV